MVDCPVGNAYKISVTGLAFPPPPVIRGRSADNRNALLCALLRLLWRPSAGSPQQRRISVKPIVSKLLLNTSRREFGVPQGFAQLLSEKGACVTCFPSHPHRHSDPERRISVSIANDFYQLTIPLVHQLTKEYKSAGRLFCAFLWFQIQ